MKNLPVLFKYLLQRGFNTKSAKRRLPETQVVLVSKNPCRKLAFALALLTALLSGTGTIAKTARDSASATIDTLRPAKLYSISGVGFGFTGGQTNKLIQPMISTNLGFQLTPARSNVFIYPTVDFLVFDYDQQTAEPRFPFNTRDGRATVTSLTISVGYRHSSGPFGLYLFAGSGGALVKEPRVTVDNTLQLATVHKIKSYTMTMKTGLGVDYSIGQFTMFAEGSYQHNFKKIQDISIHIFPAVIGIRSNLSAVLNKL